MNNIIQWLDMTIRYGLANKVLIGATLLFILGIGSLVLWQRHSRKLIHRRSFFLTREERLSIIKKINNGVG